MKYSIEIVNQHPELNEFVAITEMCGGQITEIFYDPTCGYTKEGYLSIDVCHPRQNFRISGSGIQSEGNFMFLQFQRDYLDEDMKFLCVDRIAEYPGPYPIPQ